MAAITRAAIIVPDRWPHPPGDPQNSAGGLKTRRMRCNSRVGSACDVILGALALFFGPFHFTRTFRKRFWLHVVTLWTSKTLLGVERELKFYNFSAFSIYLFSYIKITPQNALQHAPVALKTRPKRFKSAPRRA